ncbi:hypothetical protein SAMN05216389_10437 [Oceanobacillus limi]|uniref:Uncharacterized protein n=1 Tax=Oceanobacillus limi TaxID=930131 RepID=A0A1I0AU07_9BACI|nr:hypothetical protein [Oceanobacillus limi]SES97893.1 hypothetical protein SAMN05216389_10437 [Oceanobacillus limi]
MNDWLIRMIMVVVALPFIFYFIALGKNVRQTEKEHKKDMTYELNPFTGMKMPEDDNKRK